MRHYITKYKNEENKLIVVSWLQINILGRCYCFWKKELAIQRTASNQVIS